ncbi:MAG: TrbI/VirB10 family protein [Candidatus Thiodiazotropha sp. (ex Dulcina madagascariensis)]|nr:TrbI/VirB10 family protein [Candidatus Thiodiazotropha sp. (ex Dulcina madagascariensis)]
MTDTDDQMTPEASPGAVGKKAGVRRVNNMPMYIIGGVLVAFLLMMILVAMDRASQQGMVEEEEKPVGPNMALAQGMVGDKEGIIPAEKPEIPELPAEPEPQIIVAKLVDPERPPIPPQQKQLQQDLKQPERDEEADKIRAAKFAMFQEAVKAKTGIEVVLPGSSGSSYSTSSRMPRTRDEMVQRIEALRRDAAATSVDDPATAYKARLEQAKQIMEEQRGGISSSGGSGGGSPMLIRTAASSEGYGQFGSATGEDRWALNSKMDTPATPYVLRAGFVLPATLISGINSDLPGQIVAQVSQNVYDTAVGRHLLVPQGSKLIGVYSSDVAYGQGRVLVAWQRIVFPDGKALDIGSMPGSDGAGYAGLHDKVNNHYLRIFGSAFLMSVVTAGITLSQDKENSNNSNTRASDALSEALGQQLGQVTAQMIAKNLNIAPTLENRPGFRFNVIVTKDMMFTKPYQDFDY